MDTEDIEKLLSISSGCADIQRAILNQTVCGKKTISDDRRNDIIRTAERIINLARELS